MHDERWLRRRNGQEGDSANAWAHERTWWTSGPNEKSSRNALEGDCARARVKVARVRSKNKTACDKHYRAMKNFMRSCKSRLYLDYRETLRKDGTLNIHEWVLHNCSPTSYRAHREAENSNVVLSVLVLVLVIGLVLVLVLII